MNQAELVSLFDRQADRYDKRRKRKMQRKMRETLLASARGSVLEIAVGAGNSFPFYAKDVKVTGIDFSPAMVEKARQAAIACGIDAALTVANVESMEFPEDSFDTAVSTLSLCGYEDPVKVLQKLRKCCKPDARILLMEHGISHNPLYAWFLRRIDGWSYRRVGCHQTRDIMGIVEDAGLRVHQVKHYMLGSVHLVWASPNK